MDRSNQVWIFPNNFPYNELLLDGKLLAKTRNWDTDYRGDVLLYTSKRNATSVWQSYNMPPKNFAHSAIIGRGKLVDCRPLNHEERWKILKQFNPLATNDELEYGWDIIHPMHYGFFFEDLVRFPKPVPFAWPAGAVLPLWRSREEMKALLP